MKYLIAVPCLDMMHTRFVASLVGMNKFDGRDHVEIMFSQNSLVYDSRNGIAAKAITQKFDRVLWLDSDMVFEPDLMQRLAARLDEGYDIVTGLYFTRKLPVQPVVYKSITQEPPAAESYIDYPKNGFFEVAGCGFGGVMTTTQALYDVGHVYGNPFSPLPGIGEDFSFCLRATSLGKRIYCDASVKLKHCSNYEIGEADFEKIKEIGTGRPEENTLGCLDDGRGGV